MPPPSSSVLASMHASGPFVESQSWATIPLYCDWHKKSYGWHAPVMMTSSCQLCRAVLLIPLLPGSHVLKGVTFYRKTCMLVRCQLRMQVRIEGRCRPLAVAVRAAGPEDLGQPLQDAVLFLHGHHCLPDHPHPGHLHGAHSAGVPHCVCTRHCQEPRFQKLPCDRPCLCTAGCCSTTRPFSGHAVPLAKIVVQL